MGELLSPHKLESKFKVIFPAAFFVFSIFFVHLTVSYVDYQQGQIKPSGEIYDVGPKSSSYNTTTSGYTQRDDGRETKDHTSSKKVTPTPAKVGMGDVQRAGNQYNNGVSLTDEMAKAQQEMSSRTGDSASKSIITSLKIIPAGKPITDCPLKSINIVESQTQNSIFTSIWNKFINLIGLSAPNQPEMMTSSLCRTPLYDTGTRAVVPRNPGDAGDLAWDECKRQGCSDAQATLAAQTAWNKFAAEHPETVIPEEKQIGNQMDLNRQLEINKIKQEICAQTKCKDWSKIDSNTFSEAQINRIRDAGNQAICDYYKAQQTKGVVTPTTTVSVVSAGYAPSALAKDKCASLSGGDRSNCEQVVDKTIAASIQQGKGIPLDQYLVIKDGKVVDIDWKNFGDAMAKLGDTNPINSRAVAYAEAERQGIDLSKFSAQQLEQITVAGGHVTDIISQMNEIVNDKKAGLLPINGVFGLPGDKQFKIVGVNSLGNPLINLVDGPTDVAFALPSEYADINKYGIDKNLYEAIKLTYQDRFQQYQTFLESQKAITDRQKEDDARATAQQAMIKAQQEAEQKQAQTAQWIEEDLQASALQISMRQIRDADEKNYQANLNLVNILRDSRGFAENTVVTGIDGENTNYSVSTIDTYTGSVILQAVDSHGDVQIKEKSLSDIYNQIYQGTVNQVSYVAGNALIDKTATETPEQMGDTWEQTALQLSRDRTQQQELTQIGSEVKFNGSDYYVKSVDNTVNGFYTLSNERGDVLVSKSFSKDFSPATTTNFFSSLAQKSQDWLSGIRSVFYNNQASQLRDKGLTDNKLMVWNGQVYQINSSNNSSGLVSVKNTNTGEISTITTNDVLEHGISGQQYIDNLGIKKGDYVAINGVPLRFAGVNDSGINVDLRPYRYDVTEGDENISLKDVVDNNALSIYVDPNSLDLVQKLKQGSIVEIDGTQYSVSNIYTAQKTKNGSFIEDLQYVLYDTKTGQKVEKYFKDILNSNTDIQVIKESVTSPSMAGENTPNQITDISSSELIDQSAAAVNDSFPLQLASKFESVFAPETSEAIRIFNDKQEQARLDAKLTRLELETTQSQYRVAKDQLVQAQQQNDQVFIQQTKDKLAQIQATGEGLSEFYLDLTLKQRNLESTKNTIPPTVWDTVFKTDRYKQYRTAALEAAINDPTVPQKGQTITEFPYYQFDANDISYLTEEKQKLREAGQLLPPKTQELIDQGVLQLYQKDGHYYIGYNYKSNNPLAQFYKEFPGSERYIYNKFNDGSTQGLFAQTDATCFISILTGYAIPLLRPGTPPIDPFVLAAMLNLDVQNLKDQESIALKDKSMNIVYGNHLASAAKATAINGLVQVSNFSDFTQMLGDEYQISYKKDDVYSRYVATLKLKDQTPDSYKYSNFLVDYFNSYSTDNERKNALLLTIDSDITGMQHAYVVRHIVEHNGKQYFNVLSARLGTEAAWPFYEGKLIANKDKTVDIPIDEIKNWSGNFSVLSDLSGESQNTNSNLQQVVNINDELNGWDSTSNQAAATNQDTSSASPQTPQGQSIATTALQNVANYEDESQGIVKGDVINYIKSGNWGRAWTTVDQVKYWVTKDAEGKNFVVYTENSDNSQNIIGQIPI